MSTIRVDFNVLNQKGTPALYSDSYANRPAAGYGGRLFISVDTHQIFQDVITGWNLIADTGSGSSNLDQVTANGNSTTHGINILGGDLTLQSTQKLYVIGLANGGVLFPSSGSGLIDQDTTNFVWDNTNKRLGLGTATPGVRLDIHSSTGVNAQFNGTGVTNATLQMQSAGTSKWTLGNYYNGGNNDFNIYDNVNGSYRAYFLNTGYAIFPNSVIIGSSSRSSSYTLDVSGTGRFTGNTIIGTRTTGNIRNLNIYGGTNNNAILKLDGADGNGYGAQVEFISKNSGGTSNQWTLGTGITTGSNTFELYNGTGVVMAATIAGNVGIGTPSFYNSKLNIQKASSESQPNEQIRMQSTGGAVPSVWRFDVDAANGGFAITDNTNGERFRIATNGKITTNVTLAGDDIMNIQNPSASGYGISIVGGNGTQYTLSARNYLGAVQFQVNGGGLIYAPNIGSSTGTAMILDSSGYIRTLTSSIRYKKDIEPIDIGLNFILSLNAVSYNLKDGNIPQVGFIAEDFPDDRLVSLSMIDKLDESKGYQKESVNYAQIVAPLVKAIQELNEKLVRNNIN